MNIFQKEKNFSSNRKRGGFIMLYAILLVTIVLTISLAIVGVSLKQTALARMTRDSSIAFYSADAALECALFIDLTKPGQNFEQSDSSLFTSFCTGVTFSTPKLTRYDNVWIWTMDAMTSGGKCASIQIYKSISTGIGSTATDISGNVSSTEIDASGYNTPTCPTQDQNPNRVERGLRATY